MFAHRCVYPNVCSLCGNLAHSTQEGTHAFQVTLKKCTSFQWKKLKNRNMQSIKTSGGQFSEWGTDTHRRSTPTYPSILKKVKEPLSVYNHGSQKREKSKNRPENRPFFANSFMKGISSQRTSFSIQSSFSKMNKPENRPENRPVFASSFMKVIRSLIFEIIRTGRFSFDSGIFTEPEQAVL